MTTLVLVGALALVIWRMRVHTARLRRSAARDEVLSEREAAERLRPYGSGSKASTQQAPAPIKSNGWRG